MHRHVNAMFFILTDLLSYLEVASQSSNMEMPKTTTPVYDDAYYDDLVKFLEKYDDYNLPHDYVEEIPTPDFDIASQVFLTLTIILGCAALVPLLTAFSAKTRTVSVSWYMYSLALETVIQTLVFTPFAHSSK